MGKTEMILGFDFPVSGFYFLVSNFHFPVSKGRILNGSIERGMGKRGKGESGMESHPPAAVDPPLLTG